MLHMLHIAKPKDKDKDNACGCPDMTLHIAAACSGAETVPAVANFVKTKRQRQTLWCSSLPKCFAHCWVSEPQENLKKPNWFQLEFSNFAFWKFLLAHLDAIQLFGPWCSGSLHLTWPEELALFTVGQKTSFWACNQIVQSQVSQIFTWVDPFQVDFSLTKLCRVCDAYLECSSSSCVMLKNCACKSPNCSFKLQQTEVVQERLTRSNLQYSAQRSWRWRAGKG